MAQAAARLSPSQIGRSDERGKRYGTEDVTWPGERTSVQCAAGALAAAGDIAGAFGAT